MEKDIFTSLVRAKRNDICNVIPVKSSEAVDKALWIEFSKVLSRMYVSIPIKVGSIVCKNILNTGIDIICTRDINKEE